MTPQELAAIRSRVENRVTGLWTEPDRRSLLDEVLRLRFAMAELRATIEELMEGKP